MRSFDGFLIMILVFIKGGDCDRRLLKYLQPNDIHSGKYDNLTKNAYHICTRECKPGDYRTCYYRFVVEHYMSMNGACRDCPNVAADCDAKACVPADGHQRSIITVNRMMPAPSIQVCKGDNVVVDVKNMMPGNSLAIHWHGLRQVHAKHMDGVPMVTQCPILESQIFRYHFPAVDCGTQFYHSHSGLQKVDGLVGACIIRCPKSEDPHRKLFDSDLPSNTIVIQDWKHNTAESGNPGIQAPGADQRADTYLIQGRGQYINGSIPFSSFRCTRGKRHLFRIIAGTCFTCTYTLTIENHEFIIVGADGPPTKPYKVNSLTMSPGERFSVIVHCNQRVGSYWIQVRTVGYCADKRAHQLAILKYDGHDGTPSTAKPTYDVTKANDPGLTVNPVDSNCTEKDREELGPCICHLRSESDTPIQLYETPHTRLIWGVGFYLYPNNIPYTNHSLYTKYIAPEPNVSVISTVNGKAHIMPPSPLLSQYEDVPENLYCPYEDYSNFSRWNTEVHECVNVFRVPLKTTVKIMMIDTDATGMIHPIHLHGYDIYVAAQGVLPQIPNGTFSDRLTALLEDMDNRKDLHSCMVKKDTIALPRDGWIMGLIHTNNPGFWLFHCHFAYHLESGMGGVLQVGRPSDMPRPPFGFPKCGDYLPLIADRDEDFWDY